MKVYLNGKFLNKHNALISPLDEGFLFGKGLFETFRSFKNQIPFLKEHLIRLRKSANLLGIPVKESDKKLKTILFSLLKINKLANAYIKIVVTSGANSNPTTFILMGKLQKISKSLLEKGVDLEISKFTRSKNSFLLKHKSTNYLENLLARQFAVKNGYTNALILDNSKTYVTECASANVFLVKNNKVFTPELETFPILPGITRKIVINISKKLKLPVFEKKISLTEFQNADEIFLTGSLHGIIPVRKIENKTYIENPGKITKILIAEYLKLVNNLVE